MRLSLGITPKSYFSLAAATDADAQAFITAAGITDATQKSAVNQLVLDLKSANIWTKMKAIYPVLGGSASSHKWNLKDARDLDAAFRLTFSTGWTHASTGMTPNGAAYADTFLTPSTNITSMNNHLSYYSRLNSSTFNYILGCQDDFTTATGKTFFAQYYVRANTGRTQIQTIDANPLEYSEDNSLGLILSTRISSSNLKVYRNNTLKATQTITATGNLPSIKYYLGGINYRSTGGAFTIVYGTRECAFASIGDGLTDTEATNFYTAVQTYQTTLGRNV